METEGSLPHSQEPATVLYTIKLFFEILTKQEMPTDRNTRGTFILLLPPIIFRLI